MLVGLTFDLRDEYLAAGYGPEQTAEFDKPETIEGIETALRELGHATDRIGHIRQLAKRLVRGDRWDAVFNIAEGLHGVGREAQVPALLDAYEIAYTFCDPLCAALTLHKGMAKRILRAAGVATSDFVEVADEHDLAAVALPYPLFVKPIHEGTGKGVSAASRVTTPVELRIQCQLVWQRFGQAALVETFLPGREFTTGVLGAGRGARAIGTLEVLPGASAEAHAYTYENKENWQGKISYKLLPENQARDASGLAVAAWQAVGGRDAGRIDLREDAQGRLQVMEVNALPGMNPIHSDLPMLAREAGISYRELVRQIIEPALQRGAALRRAT